MIDCLSLLTRESFQAVMQGTGTQAGPSGQGEGAKS